MTENSKEHDVIATSQIQYAICLTTIYNWLFPPLLDKALDFWVWFFTEKQPESILSLDSLEYALEVLDREKPTDINSLAELVQRLTIPDAIAVREAIRFRLNHLDMSICMMRITTSDAVAIVSDCLNELADEVRRSEGKRRGDGTTRKRRR